MWSVAVFGDRTPFSSSEIPMLGLAGCCGMIHSKFARGVEERVAAGQWLVALFLGINISSSNYARVSRLLWDDPFRCVPSLLTSPFSLPAPLPVGDSLGYVNFPCSDHP